MSADGPVRAPADGRRVLVIGAGVVGLTTAVAARERGYQVVVVADRFAPDVTSVVAGALWEWPPAVCGHHRDETSLERAKDWCMTSYSRFLDLAKEPATGVFLRPAVFYFRRPVEEDAHEHTKMVELRNRVAGFRRDPVLIDEGGVSPEVGARDAYAYLAPMVDTDAYMAWLMRRAAGLGCTVLRCRVAGSLVEQERALLRYFAADAIVNCTGLGAIDLAGEDMYPLRGALIYVHNDGRGMPRIASAHCMAHDDAIGGQNMVFIVPRGADLLVLGGLVEPHEWRTDLTFDTYPLLADMRRRCEEFLPVLRSARLYVERPVRVGLRPCRTGNVRLEAEPSTRIVHNVGHGGSGVTLSWGCAADVVDCVDHMLN